MPLVYPTPRPKPARPTLVLTALLLIVPVLAGCLGGDTVSESFVGNASGGYLFMGTDYGAATREALANGTLDVDLNAVVDTGRILAMGRFADNSTFEVAATEFVETAPFMDGGIIANIVEHGDSGISNTNWPAMHVLVASWGKGTFMMDGNATIDPYTQGEEWNLHLMITDTGVRDDATGKILKSDGTSLYDPDEPGDATVGDDLEAHLVVSSLHNGTGLDPITESASGEVTPTGGSNSAFEVPAGMVTIEVVVTLDENPASQGGFQFRLIDPDNQEQDRASFNTLMGGRTTTLKVENTTTAGIWTLTSQPTTSTPATFTAAITMTFTPPPTYYFFWEDVEVVQRVRG